MTRGGETRFRKGQSGNPKGRPKKTSSPHASAYDIIIDRTMTVARNGLAYELTIDEALQQRTYQDAIAGSRSARREVLKMIAKREQWLAAHAAKPQRKAVELVSGHDVHVANDVLVLLDIATRLIPGIGTDDPYDRLLLEPWVVEAALSRRRNRPFGEKDIAEIRRCTRVPETIAWL
jgi:hypothetical protein